MLHLSKWMKNDLKYPIKVLSSGSTGYLTEPNKKIWMSFVLQSIWKHRYPPSEVIYPLNPLCWLVDNGMQLNLLLIRVLMCVIKYITMFQLENTGAIYHFNWYPPHTTWAHHIPSVFSKWCRFLREVRVIGEHSLTLRCVCCMCVYFVCLYISGFVVFCALWDVW